MTSYLLALAGGILSALSQPKFSWSYLAFLGVALVLEAVRTRPKKAFLLSFGAGFVYFVVLLYWLFPVMYHFGGLPALAAAGALGLLAAYLALYWALPVTILARVGHLREKVSSAFFFACLFTSFEFLRAKVPFAFPWGLLGASQYRELFLIQIADFGGVYALSFLVALVNYAVFSFVSYRKKALLLLAFLALLSTYLYGAWRLEKPFTGPNQQLGLIQGNIPQDQKWAPENLAETLLKYQRLSKKALEAGAELIIWPETALPTYVTPTNPLVQKLLAWTEDIKAPLIFGAPYYEEGDGEVRIYNSLFLAEAGQFKARYDKQRLVPFGEFVPFEKIFPWLRSLAVASGEYSPGPNSSPLSLDRERIFGPLICFESIFSDLARAQVLKGATILLVATNDAWFGTTAGPYQHFAQAVFRAVETRRYVVRVANTGISGLIDPYGRILKKTPLEKEAAPCVKAQHLTYFSWYDKYGDFFSFSCIILAAIITLISILRREKI